MDATAHRRAVQGGQEIDEAGGQTAQAAIAEGHVGLLSRRDRISSRPSSRSASSQDLVQGEVVQVVGGQTPTSGIQQRDSESHEYLS